MTNPETDLKRFIKKVLMLGYCHGICPSSLVRAGFKIFDLRSV